MISDTLNLGAKQSHILKFVHFVIHTWSRFTELDLSCEKIE
jgi:hypothetical protein